MVNWKSITEPMLNEIGSKLPLQGLEMNNESLMPPLQHAMTTQQLADLLAYLSSLTKQ